MKRTSRSRPSADRAAQVSPAGLRPTHSRNWQPSSGSPPEAGRPPGGRLAGAPCFRGSPGSGYFPRDRERHRPLPAWTGAETPAGSSRRGRLRASRGRLPGERRRRVPGNGGRRAWPPNRRWGCRCGWPASAGAARTAAGRRARATSPVRSASTKAVQDGNRWRGPWPPPTPAPPGRPPTAGPGPARPACAARPSGGSSCPRNGGAPVSSS